MAGFIRRAMAFFIDHLILSVFLLFSPDRFLIWYASVIVFSFIKIAITFVIIILFFEFYFIIVEWIWGGQTPGKWLFSIRAVKADGARLDFYSSFIRNALRCTYLVPFLFFIPDLICFVVSNKKRIGDVIAETIVIRQN
ncbi:MAG: RDD family protein [Ignavibacteria bacterium]